MSFRRSSCLFFSKNECTEGGNSFLACHSFSVFMSSPAKLQNMHQILPFGRAKCSFDARNPANSYFCKIALHFMHIFLAFCAGFPIKTAVLKFLLHFLLAALILFSERQTASQFWNEVLIMLAIIGACGAVYLAGMVFMTVKGMKAWHQCIETHDIGVVRRDTEMLRIAPYFVDWLSAACLNPSGLVWKCCRRHKAILFWKHIDKHQSMC